MIEYRPGNVEQLFPNPAESESVRLFVDRLSAFPSVKRIVTLDLELGNRPRLFVLMEDGFGGTPEPEDLEQIAELTRSKEFRTIRRRVAPILCESEFEEDIKNIGRLRGKTPLLLWSRPTVDSPNEAF